ncbi:hypothetical protein K7W42_10350 [Deinococcus sp. HMF7604]|uniref:hypothetical protein n=1 Tax=Deinococcus betulae TaxID=2873312 RepID=UPI001CCA64AF|nr:hypothetical protein [Deinococcus betulae]MBZ9751265.1 hypothetical protein [Deinococcus betulae]
MITQDEEWMRPIPCSPAVSSGVKTRSCFKTRNLNDIFQETFWPYELERRGDRFETSKDTFFETGIRARALPYRQGHLLIVEKALTHYSYLLNLFESVSFSRDTLCSKVLQNDKAALIETCQLNEFEDDRGDRYGSTEYVLLTLTRHTEFGRRGEPVLLIIGLCNWFIKPLKDL